MAAGIRTAADLERLHRTAVGTMGREKGGVVFGRAGVGGGGEGVKAGEVVMTVGGGGRQGRRKVRRRCWRGGKAVGAWVKGERRRKAGWFIHLSARFSVSCWTAGRLMGGVSLLVRGGWQLIVADSVCWQWGGCLLLGIVGSRSIGKVGRSLGGQTGLAGPL